MPKPPPHATQGATSERLSRPPLQFSLRQYFAGQVVLGIAANPACTFFTNERMAEEAWKIADAMITAEHEINNEDL